MQNDRVIYVYKIGENQHSAGYFKKVCERRGNIVESWPVDTPEQIEYVKRHGTVFKSAYDRVKLLAERAENRLEFDREEYDEKREALLLELSEQPFRQRWRNGWKLIFGRAGSGSNK